MQTAMKASQSARAMFSAVMPHIPAHQYPSRAHNFWLS
jgi:hypothetical protein